MLLSIEKDLDDVEKKAQSRKTQLVWPANTINKEPRTKEQLLDIINRIENGNEELTNYDVKGVKGRSLLIDLPGFDIVNDIPTEYLHSVSIGLVKRLLELTFNMGSNRQRTTTRKLSSPGTFNQLLTDIKVPHEFSRRIRDLDFNVYKAQEFRNVLIFLFPIVLECIEIGCRERDLWLLLAFMIRACIIPNNEFNYVEKNDIKMAAYSFYTVYEQLFGPRNCTYTVHVVCSHILQIRGIPL